ncbi:MFS transporter [Citromicrobium sp. RCC1885]|uniref:NnrU family protein n=1 Tax=unclassified Citromicrobium TaxID=2630544 RepID=UPI0006C8F97D|nr:MULTISPECIES: NnrU family protein [unclassified Citromicrobium]KPM24439.1 MFS transporter [Citromicrobium sp. RCC1885]KPM27681.1 MFS transporter [Citromicrobium sp. RCC1878]MAO05029.1 MFS transporter [Citromicrobium sp.]OAM10826.1 MFS transporter [Citromicrobium sp. RCC1897]|tara:strand:- start:1208 stop:1876 length:669 start_codon:yes stop_codon:yes gene_type:complete
MVDPLVSLIAASIAFVGTHFAMSHPLRASMVRLLGDGGFMIAYSLVSAATMAWMYFAFVATPAGAPLWGGYGDGVWIVASIITLLALVLFAGSLIGNPALPAPNAEKAALQAPSGVFKVTRHPMMWGFGLWAFAHLIAAPTSRTVVVALAIGVLALIGARLQDRKKELLMGDAWRQWEANTSYWPRLGRIFSVGIVPWIGGIAIWLGATWWHTMDAGVWRWV